MANTADMKISASLEDYLETILKIIQEKSAVRAKDIGKRLKVTRPSVTGALQSLAKKELINYAPYDVITLTEKGRRVAEDVLRRHEVLRDFFVKVLAVEPEDADQAACKMEHAIPDKILERFVEFVEFVERCPRGGSKWIKGFGYYCDNDKETENCETCVELVLDEVRSKKKMQNATDEQTLTTLGEMKPGTKAAIVKISGSGHVRRRLLDMGATAGTLVEVERVAPLGDPIEVKVKGYHLTLRKEEAHRIAVKSI